MNEPNRMNEPQEKPEVELQAGECQVAMTIQIKRAATGKVDEYTLTGTMPREMLEQKGAE